MAAYGAALALTPYLLIKVSWVIGALLGLVPLSAEFDMAGWVVLNVATIGMAATGIVTALALVRPWGMRIPGAAVAFCTWVGAGFLVPLLPFIILGSLLGPEGGGEAGGGEAGGGEEQSGGGGDDGAVMPVWEGRLIQFGFVGMGLCLALALPVYLRRRWPDAFAGRVGEREGGTPSGPPPWVVFVGAALGAVWLYWAAGGTAGVAQLAARDANWHLLTGTAGVCALASAAAVWALTRARPAGLPRWIPMALGWLGSGSLFAWSGWKLPYTLVLAAVRPDDVTLPENLGVAAALHIAAVVAGAAMLRALVRPSGQGALAVP